jgi:hypothetical protein
MYGIFGGYAMGSIRRDMENAREAASAKSQAQSTRLALESLEDRVDRLMLVNMALWELLRERTELSEEDLLQKVQEIDLRDGKPDGKVSQEIAKCPKCNRTMSTRHGRCLYCGAEKLDRKAFDSAY